MTYDTWKTTEPESDEPVGQCDCCARMLPLHRVWAFGNLETWACDECCNQGE